MSEYKINALEMLNIMYDKCAASAIQKIVFDMTMKESGLKFRLYKGNKLCHETFTWKIEFEKSIDFGYGNWKTFYFDSDREMGRFLFNAGINGGIPKGGKLE